jgi:hypothetical protein
LDHRGSALVPTYEITSPDGRKFRVTGNGTKEEALAQVQQQYVRQSSAPSQNLRPFDPGLDKPRPNADGSFSTEITRTVQTPNGWANVPSLWWNESGSVDLGDRSDDELADMALSYEKSSGQSFPRFRSIGEAESAAKARSAQGGATHGRLAAPSRPYDSMNDAPRLPGEAGFDDPSIRPLSDAYDSLGKRASRFGRNVNAAAGELNRAEGSPALGLAEVGGTMVTGALAPVVGTARHLVTGEPLEQAIGESVYQPRSEQGRAQLGMLGALASPLTESGADVALGPLFAAESRALASAPARIPPNARRNSPSGSAVPAQPGAVARTDAPGEASHAPAAPAKRSAGLGRVSEEPPTVDELAAQAKAAYKRASDSGIRISPASLTGLKVKIVGALNKEGIDPTLHPATTAALKRVTGTDGEVTLDQLETLRKIASDAKGSQAPADARLAAKIVDEIDDYVVNLSEKDVTSGKIKDAAALREARNLYSRKMKAEEIGSLVERAGVRAGQFSGSGYENALRTEFRQLALNKNRMRRFTAEEQAAIKKVAMGGPAENTFRFIGKFAPTGVVSAALGGGLGAMVAGPGGAAVPLVGLGGRAIATRMTNRNVRRAEELMRRGPQLKPQQAQTTRQKAPLEY